MSNKSASLAGHQPLTLLVSLQWEGAWCGGFAGCFRSGGSRVGLKPGSEPGRKQREEAAPAFLERRAQWFRPARDADVTPARRPGCLGASRRRVSRRVAGGAADSTRGVESAVPGCGDLVAAPPSEPGPAPRSASSSPARGNLWSGGRAPPAGGQLALKRERRRLFESPGLGVGRPGFHLYVLEGGSELLDFCPPSREGSRRQTSVACVPNSLSLGYCDLYILLRRG
ncbi:uncharacterized protein LOC106969059 isoform X6 [Acinonyx jubatus]|uniref:Uncharacterized protein LOC106969059 isoform X6 n=1 Tax=Acinonyx jubatus TaxID=32536 RepID=A0ABM3PV41_ACIJB|nr:uncharacterized protein LOC106969059 isoform X6 [Acinonyx jubatus]